MKILITLFALAVSSWAGDMSAKVYVAKVTPEIVRDVPLARDWDYIVGVRIEDANNNPAISGYRVYVESTYNGWSYRYTALCNRGSLWSLAVLQFPHHTAKIISLKITRLMGEEPLDVPIVP